jgi:hypothetical protein
LNDPRAAEAMRRYLAILNDIQRLGVEGFARLLDSSSTPEMTSILQAAEIIEKQIDRYTRP